MEIVKFLDFSFDSKILDDKKYEFEPVLLHTITQHFIVRSTF